MSDFKGTNDFKLTKFIFYERLRFKLQAYEDSNHTNLKEINFGELSLYGRVDYNLNAVYPLNSSLNFFHTNKYAINFVANAFQDVVNHFRNAYGFEKISLNEKHLSDIRASESYVDPLNLYSQYIDQIFETYNDSYAITTNVKTFEGYVDNLIPYMRLLGSEFPMTFSSWMRNKNASPFVSGLYINISSNAFDVDSLKERDFINSPNFDFYVNTCKSKGFYVSKRNPSLLIADINSEQMKQYMLPYGINDGEDLFNTYYQLAYTQDIDLMLNKIIEHYNNFMNDMNPIQSEIKISRDNKIYHRLYNLNKDYNINNNILYKLYLNIKNIEEDNVFGQADIKRFEETAKNIEKRFDRERAVDYINKQFSSTYASKYGGLNYYKKKFDLMED